MSKLFKKSGETIVEVMGAILIITISLVSVFTLLGNAIIVGENIENKVTALNLAREGLEIVRNQRDTNWLQFAGSRRTNWLCYEESGNTCSNRIGSTVEYFRTDYFNPQPVQRVAAAALLDISGTGSANAEEFRLKVNLVDGDRYEHTLGIDSIFYRQLILQHETNDPCDITAGDCQEDRLKAIVRIQWEESNAIRTMELEAYLYDFFERDSY